MEHLKSIAASAASKFEAKKQQVQQQIKAQKDKILTPDRIKSIARAGRITRQGLVFSLFAGTGIGIAGTAYDVVAHSRGNEGITQGYTWLAVSEKSCIHVGFVASHQVMPEEHVSLYIRPFVGDPTDKSNIQNGIVYNLSDKPVEVGFGQEFCFSEP